jgi:hypothetical protein
METPRPADNVATPFESIAALAVPNPRFRVTLPSVLTADPHKPVSPTIETELPPPTDGEDIEPPEVFASV